MKIGILTYHRSRNYGAFLQAVALCYRLNKEDGIQAEIVDYNMKIAQKLYKPTLWPPRKVLHLNKYLFDRQMAAAFERGYTLTASLRSETSLVSDDLAEFQRFVRNRYDVMIAGSDEIWNVHYARGFAKPYFLVGDLGCRKFAYAASARADFDCLTETDRHLLNEALLDFEFISVRDQATYDIVKREGVNEGDLMMACDPSFLCDFAFEKRPLCDIVKDRRLDPSKKTVVVMCENESVKQRIREDLRRDYNLVAVAVPARGYICKPDLDPFEWFALIRSADFVISSFFHGVCFSVVNDTPFVAVASSTSRKSKLYGLLHGTLLESRYIDLDQEDDVSWHEIIEARSGEVCYRDFVLEQRAGFQCFIERLKGGR